MILISMGNNFIHNTYLFLLNVCLKYLNYFSFNLTFENIMGIWMIIILIQCIETFVADVELIK